MLQIGMPRHFYIYEGDSGDCTVKDESDGTPFHFMNVLEAMAFVHRQCGTEEIAVSYYNASGNLVFTKMIEQERNPPRYRILPVRESSLPIRARWRTGSRLPPADSAIHSSND